MTIDKQPEYPIKQVELSTNPPSSNHEPRYKTSINSINQITKLNISISLKRPTDFVFEPGQYIWLVLPELTKFYGTIDRKAYSIASNPNSDSLDILIHLSGSDFSSKISHLKKNDEVEIIGPMGSSFVISDNGAVIATDGMGIIQFLSTLRSQAAKNVCIIIYNSDDSLPYNKKELNELSNTYKYEITYFKSRPLVKDISKIIDKKEKRPIFIAGSQNFVNHITDVLLDIGINETQMHYEENYPQIETDKKIEEIVDSIVDIKPDNKQVVKNLNNLFIEAAKESNTHVILADRNGRILFANQAAVNLTGYSFDEMRGQTPRLWGGLMPEHLYKQLWSEIHEGTAIRGNVTNRNRNGALYTVQMTIIPIKLSGMVIAYLATEDDVTKMQEMDKAKTEFIPIISHQLRTLLSVISWYTEMLIDGDAGKLSIKQRKYLKAIYSGNQHMVELLNSLLNVSKIELGALAVEPEPTNLVELANNIVSEQKIDIKEKKLNISTVFEKDIPIVLTDPKLLRMIIQNLLSNSVKYTPENGKIVITFSMHNKRYIMLKVSDTGFGIPKNQQSKIFTKLFRADNAKRKDSEGTGLGLYIVKSIVDKIGGKIWFESKENKGTTFYVQILIKTAKKN